MMKVFRWILGFGVFAMAIVGCGADVPAPRLTGVDPEWGYNGEPTDIAIEGHDLLPRVQVTGGTADRLDHQWRAWLLSDPEVELLAVRGVSYQELQAVVPDGVDPGEYGVRVEAPTGKRATLARAFTVTDTRADHLAVTTSGISWTVEQVAILRLALQDPTGNVVPQALEVEITVEGNNADASAYTFELGGLTNATVFPDGSGVRGRLGITGDAFIGFTSEVPDDLWLRFTPVGEPNIERASQLLSFRAGHVARIEIDLPENEFTPQAGQEFPIHIRMVDDLGNPVSGEHATVALVEACPSGTLNLVEAFVDDAVMDVALTGAISDACTENAIVAFGVVEGMSVQGKSGPIGVLPGPLDRFDVHASPSEVQAGADPVTVYINGRDEWGNAVKEELDPITLSDDVGPLSESMGNGTHSCHSLDLGEALCSATLFRSGEGLPLLASVESGAEGLSNLLTVTPGPADHVEVLLLTATAIAGEAFTVGVRILDEFDNPFPMTSDMLGALSFLDDSGPIGCVLVSSDEGTAIYTHHCSATVALPGNHVTVLAPTLGAIGISTPFDVVAGPLNEVNISVDPSGEAGIDDGIVAGAPFIIQLEGMDAFGNPANDSVGVALANVTQSIEPGTVSLVDGVAEVSVVITGARRGDSISALYLGSLVGISTPFDVLPGSATALVIENEEPWAWVGTPFAATLSVVDGHGNVAEGDPVEVSLRSAGGLGSEVIQTVNGQAQVDFLFDFAGVGDSLLANGGGWSSASDDFDVALECIDGSSMEPSVPGAVYDSLCLDEGGSVDAMIHAGEEGLHHYRFIVDGKQAGTSSNAIIEHTWLAGESGPVRVLGIDADGCGAAGAIPMFVGAVGEATGPISVVPGRETLIGGTAGGDEATEVSLSARQCTGDVASGERLFVWAELGALDAAPGEVIVASGTGLEVVLDAEGEGRLVWTAAETRHPGEPWLFVGTHSGSASGSTSVSIEGDSDPPEVLSQTPVGTTAAGFDEVVVDFSEGMLTSLSDTTMLETVELRDPFGAIVLWADTEWSEEGHRLTVFFSAVLDATEGAWQVSLTDELRDLAGNRLDGDVDEVAGGDHAVLFGAVPFLPPDVLTCSPDTAVFRPDGDPGSGQEADRVVLEIETDIDGEWWWLDVSGPNGELIQRFRARRAGFTMGALEWDGRDLGGSVVQNGVYAVEITASDEYWNMGLPCEVAIRVDNHLTAEE